MKKKEHVGYRKHTCVTPFLQLSLIVPFTYSPFSNPSLNMLHVFLPKKTLLKNLLPHALFLLPKSLFFDSFPSPFSVTPSLKKHHPFPFQSSFHPLLCSPHCSFAPCLEMSPSLTTTMARWWCPWPCVHAYSS